jgi:hypothetical protein
MHCPDDDEELELFYRVTNKQIEHGFLAELSTTDSLRNVLIQERLLGDEYGMDVVSDLNGNYVCTFVKRKIWMRAGQTDQAVTVRDDRPEMIRQIIGEKLGQIGLLDCDAFITKRGCYVIIMNPRIGGGYHFSHIAGANLPAALIAWASGQPPDPAWFRIEPNVAASRYDSLVATNRKPIETARSSRRHCCTNSGEVKIIAPKLRVRWPDQRTLFVRNVVRRRMSPGSGKEWFSNGNTILTPMKQRSQLGERLFDLALTLLRLKRNSCKISIYSSRQ